MGELRALFNGVTEVCIDSGDGLLAAVEGSADRVELCSALAVGGLTPSMAMIEVAPTVITAHVLIRPRPGDFCYTPDEAAHIERDIMGALRLGAHGVVVGALRPDGSIDTQQLANWREAAGLVNPDAAFVVHRAIDMTPDPVRAMDDLAELGCSLVLTSGGAPTAMAGADTIRRMVEHGGVPVLAGGGITPDNVGALIDQTGVTQVHFASRATRPSAMMYRNTMVHMGSDAFDEYQVEFTDADRVKATVQAARRAWSDRT